MRRIRIASCCIAAGLLAANGAAQIDIGEAASGWWINSLMFTTAEVANTIGDVNGDGFDDIVIGRKPGIAYLILGSESGWGDGLDAAVVADAKFPAPAIPFSGSEYMPNHVAGVGDVNGDGLDDFLIGAYVQNKVYLVLGRAAADWGTNFDLSSGADAVFTASTDSYLGWNFTGIGDVNDDDLDDFLIASAGTGSGNKLYVYLGRSAADWGSNFPTTSADASFGGFGISINVGHGDFNGDGKSDLALYNGSVYVQLGADPLDWGTGSAASAGAEASFTGAGAGFARGSGDIDNDGRDDLLLAANNKIGLVLGRAAADWGTGVDFFTSAVTASWGGFDSSSSTLKCAWVGDANGDDFGDFVASDHYYPSNFGGSPNNLGACSLVQGRAVASTFGTDAPLQLAPVYVLGDSDDDEIGSIVSSAGDFNGDGLGDFLVMSASRSRAYGFFSGHYPADTWSFFFNRDVPAGASVQAMPSAHLAVDFASNGAPGALVVSYTDQAPSNLPGALARTWDLTGPAGSFSATPTFAYTDEQLAAASVGDESLLRLHKSSDSGNSWTVIASTLDTGGNTIATSSPQTGFSLWAIAPVAADVHDWAAFE